MNPPDGGHPEIGPELRRLAQAVLDRLDPALRGAAAAAADSGRPPGRCQQVWCPLCALGALVTGEQHPLLGVIAEHSVALMTVIRAMAAEPAPDSTEPGQAGRAAESGAETAGTPADGAVPGGAGHTSGSTGGSNGSANGSATGRYQKIPIVVEPDENRVRPGPPED